jgi:glycosyltransferase involved in cell wall biosynthesis
MRILFFSTAFPQPHEPSRNPDNLERCVALARTHAVQVLSPLSWRHIPDIAGQDRLLSIRGLTVARPVYFYPPGLFRGVHAWCMWQGIRREASRVIARFRPDAVLSYWTYPDTAVAARVARRAGIPCVAIVGGSDVLSIDPAAPGATGKRVARALLAADGIAAVSDTIKDRLVDLGVEPRNNQVLPAAVDKTIFFPDSRLNARDQLEIPRDASVLVWVGRMVTVKALATLLEAVADASGRCPGLRLYLVGDGPLRRSLESRVVALGLSRIVTFAGRVAHRDLPSYYRAADVTVLPSHWEGLPNVLVESHACGTPFIASAVGAIPQLADPDRDDLVAPGNRRQLGDAIVRALERSDANHGDVMGSAGGWEQMADALASQLAAARRRRRVSELEEQRVAVARARMLLRLTQHRSGRAS